jgi:hypothetical protein
MPATTDGGVGTVVVVFVVILLVTTLVAAVRNLASLLSDLLRVATAVTSILFTVVVATVLGVAFLMH